MKDFAAYILAVTAFSLIGGLLSALLPQKEGKTGRYFELIVSLCVLAMLVSPLKGLLSDLCDIAGEISASEIKYGVSADLKAKDIIVRLTEEQLKEEIKKILDKKYGINARNSTITILCNTGDKENIVIEKIVIDLSACRVTGGAKEAQAYFKDLFECDCEVITK